MSRENVEVVRAMLRRFNDRDYAHVWELIDPAVEWEDPRVIPGGGLHRGHDGVRRWFSRWFDAWEEFHSEPQKLIDGGDQVIVVERMRARGRHSGIEVDQRIVSGYLVANGRVVRRIDYADEQEALEAAGRDET